MDKQILSHGLILPYENKQISFVTKFSLTHGLITPYENKQRSFVTNSLPRFNYANENKQISFLTKFFPAV